MRDGFVFALFALGVEQRDVVAGGRERMRHGSVGGADAAVADRADEFAARDANLQRAGRRAAGQGGQAGKGLEFRVYAVRTA